MEQIIALTTVDYSSLFIAIFAVLIGLKAVISIFEWIMDKLGLETKWMRQKREEHDLLIQTSKGLTALQQKHEDDIRQFRKELSESIKEIITTSSDKDKQIDNLMVAQREVLADKINDKYKYYISIEGIPEDEVDEFTNLHSAYKGVGGNHSGDAKYEYCINHLSVIPVETKLITKDNK